MLALSAVAAEAARQAPDIEKAGHIPADLWAKVADTGVLRRWIPSEYGGDEATVADTIHELELVAAHDGATAWCIMIALTTSLSAAYLPDEWAGKIYSDPNACTGGFGMPAGTATLQADGSLRVTGEWSWGSGTDHCSWIGGGVRVVDFEGEPTTTPDGAFAPFVFFDRSDVELLDTWHVSGLKGTASTDYRASNALIPPGRWAQFIGSPPRIDRSLYRFSFFGALGLGVAAVGLGLASRAVDELVAIGNKKPSGSRKTLAERPAIQQNLADAEAAVLGARAYLHQTIADSWAVAQAGPVSDADKRAIRLAAYSTMKQSITAVDLCYHAAGGSSIYETSALQRVFRDIHVASQHGMVATRVSEPLGRWRFGLPTDASQF